MAGEGGIHLRSELRPLGIEGWNYESYDAGRKFSVGGRAVQHGPRWGHCNGRVRVHGELRKVIDIDSFHDYDTRFRSLRLVS